MKIVINDVNLRNGHFRVERTPDFFPADSWGGSNQSSAARPVRFIFEGTNEEVDTDIDGTKRIPRNARGEIDRFLKHHRIREGDLIHVSKAAERRFVVQVFKPASVSTPSTSPAPIPVGSLVPERSRISVDRIVRETAVTDHVKKLYGFKCQVCRLVLTTRRGPYAEGAHIRPLGTPHNGPDKASNVLCLCANHHVMLDGGTLSVNDDLTLIGVPGALTLHTAHDLDISHLRYHRSRVAGQSDA